MRKQYGTQRTKTDPWSRSILAIGSIQDLEVSANALAWLSSTSYELMPIVGQV